MVQFQCPKCGGTEIIEHVRLQNPETGNSVESWSMGCIYQTAMATTLVAIVALVFAIFRPAHAFAEAAALVSLVTMIFVAAGIFVTWRYSHWVSVHNYTCKSCGHTWMADAHQLAPR